MVSRKGAKAQRNGKFVISWPTTRFMPGRSNSNFARVPLLATEEFASRAHSALLASHGRPLFNCEQCSAIQDSGSVRCKQWHTTFKNASNRLNSNFASRLCVRLFVLVCIAANLGPTLGQEATPAAKPETPAAADDLSVEQARLADRYKRLEEVVGRLAELSASTDPRRAKLLARRHRPEPRAGYQCSVRIGRQAAAG